MYPLPSTSLSIEYRNKIVRVNVCDSYTESSHQLVRWDEKQRENVQTLQNQVSHCALYQTSRTPTRQINL